MAISVAGFLTLVILIWVDFLSMKLNFVFSG